VNILQSFVVPGRFSALISLPVAFLATFCRLHPLPNDNSKNTSPLPLTKPSLSPYT
jgi:hypothetical protein